MALPVNPLREMFEFMAFDDALENGVSVNALLDRQEAEGRARVVARVDGLVAQLNLMIDVNEGRREGLVQEAEGLGPRHATVYCGQLVQQLQELKEGESKLKKGYELAEMESRAQKDRAAHLEHSVQRMRDLVEQRQACQSYTTGKLYEIGNALSSTIANPNRKTNDSRDQRGGSSSRGL